MEKKKNGKSKILGNGFISGLNSRGKNEGILREFLRNFSHAGGIKNSQTVSGISLDLLFLSPRIPEVFSLLLFPNKSGEIQEKTTPGTAGMLGKTSSFFLGFSAFPDFWENFAGQSNKTGLKQGI